MEEFVHARGHIASDEAEERVEDDNDGAQRSPIAWGQKSKESKGYTGVNTALKQVVGRPLPMVKPAIMKS